MSIPFLLEIGTEEIPDWMIDPALAQMREKFTALLHDKNLGGRVTETTATPRRLALLAEGLVERQADTSELVMGPPKAAAYKDGKPTGAALGFAKKMGVAVEELVVTATPKGEYLSCHKDIAGQETRDVLAASLPELILGIYFPKAMYWTGKGGPRFIRPIRWLVALLGHEVVKFELAGVTSGNSSHGHRQLGDGYLQVSAEEYGDTLRHGFVIVSSDERRERILKGAADAANALGAGLHVKTDPKLVDKLVYLTEYPTPLAGSFDATFLKLPAEVLVTVMRHHQNYFSVEDGQGKLAPHFVAVTNTSGDPEGLIRRGNERVLRARFSDAQFFYNVDQQKPLAARVDDLKNVTFQAKLGSYYEKTERNVKLARELAALVGEDPELAGRAAHLAKADLTTEMVKEFTDLQGIIGGLYAKVQGEPAEVADAVYDHYKPLSMEDSIPRTRLGQIVALADKIDTLRGCFSVGMIPSGSKDPFALRRAAQGVVKILIEGGLPLKLRDLLHHDVSLNEFFLDRLKYYFREVRGFAYDEVNAVLAAGHDQLTDAEDRLKAIQQVRPTENFEPLAASFKRIQNILRQATFTGGVELQDALVERGPEEDLLAAFRHAGPEIATQRAARNYRAALEAIASLRPKVDLFFDKVLVNAPDPAVRANRLALLYGLLSASSSIADFSEIVVAGQQQ